VFYRRFKNRDRNLNQSDRRERGFNRSRFFNYKTRVVFKIFSNTNILSEILINSEIIRGASQYKFGKKQFSSLKCAKTFQKKSEKRGNLLPMKSKSADEKVYEPFQGRNNKKSITEVTEDVILAFLDMG
jgi:hypothetical protein